MKTVIISDLPQFIQKKLPYSLRTYKDEYVIADLPSQIQFIIQDYLKNKKNIQYNTVFDIVPEISEYGDFGTINTIESTILEYVKNYFLTLPYDYPFEPTFGSTLKQHLHTKDTELRKTLISSEAESIVRTITADFGVNVKIIAIDIQNLNRTDKVEYIINISLSINNQEAKISFGSD